MPVEGRAQIPCGLEVFGYERGVLVSRAWVVLLDRHGHPPVQLGAAGPQLRLISHRSDERVPERVLGTWGEPHLVDEIDSQQFGDGVVRCAGLVQNSVQ
jgi:hypothetical protein